MAHHNLKTWPPYFQNILDGLKTFEIRRNDRDFQVGDQLELHEFEPGHDGGITGRSVLVEVTYMTDWNQRDGYVVMGIRQPQESLVERHNRTWKELTGEGP